jgi:hypothetical protein
MSKIPGPIIIVDFDGTIVEEHVEGWQGKDFFGAPIEGAVQYLTRLHNEGWHVICFTCRVNEPDGEDETNLKAYFYKIGLYFFKINDCSHNPDDASKCKPTGDVYVDNKDWRQGGKPFDFRTWKRLYYKVSKDWEKKKDK